MPKPKDLYLAVDVGGTKILAALTDASGRVLRRQKHSTPRGGGEKSFYRALEDVVASLLRRPKKVPPRALAAMGIGVPGVVDQDGELVLVAPNLGLANVKLGAYCRKTFGLPVALGNDCNVGILGEKWLGAARSAHSAMGILVGTGIGGGFIQGSRVWEGARGAASEIGHIVMEIGGPRCGCGNRGCLEALASRTAMERDLRAAIAAGQKTVLTQLLDEPSGVIRSSILREALDGKDPLVLRVLRHASEVLGHACLTVAHLLDPEVIVLGGGVVDACSEFIVPVVERVVAGDRLLAGAPATRVLVSSLGDDAVILGAAAMARMKLGEDPFKKRFAVAPSYPPIVRRKKNATVCSVGAKAFKEDFYIMASGEARRQRLVLPESAKRGPRLICREHLSRPCRGGPQTLFIATGRLGKLKLSEDACLYMKQRAIEWVALPLAEAVEAYNECKGRKAALVHLAD